jgi:hypothetical protein
MWDQVEGTDMLLAGYGQLFPNFHRGGFMVHAQKYNIVHSGSYLIKTV